MPDLHWTIPVARWSSWPAAATAAPDIGFIEPMVRRRLSTLSRVALKVAHDCAAAGILPAREDLDMRDDWPIAGKLCVGDARVGAADVSYQCAKVRHGE